MARPFQREALANRVFGRLTALEPTRLGKQRAHLCRCACGATKAVRDYYLLRGVVRSCGCAPHAPRTPAPRAGETFGALTFVERVSAAHGVAMARVRCTCGAECLVRYGNLRSGTTQSCGCQVRAALTSHGLAATAEYATWVAMLQRCKNPSSGSFADYGGRGIGVCSRWHDPTNFVVDMGPRPSAEHSIDRLDVDGGYWCGGAECADCGPLGRAPNCRWATARQQARNTRRTLARCDRNGVPRDVYVARLRAGWDEIQASEAAPA